MANRRTQTNREAGIPRYVQTYVSSDDRPRLTIAAAILPNIKKNKNAEMSS